MNVIEGLSIENFGTVVIHLDELIKKSGISKNKLCHRAEL